MEPLGEDGRKVTGSTDHIRLSRMAAAEGMVLLKNENHLLSLRKGRCVALFGKASADYVRGGGGSGDVTVAYVRNLCDGMEEKEHEGKISLFEPLHDFYRENVSQQYREDGEPGCTTEPEIPAELLTQAAAMCDTAIISICRYSAEGGDRKETDFYLSSEEQRMVTDVMALFRKVVVVLNVGGALDVHTGHGVHTGRQEAPHTHFIAPSPDRRFLLSTDLGLDSIFVYDEGLNVRSIAHVPAGQGVRHLAYADDGMTVFAANELGSTVSMFTYHDGQLTLRQTIPVLFHEYENMPAAIRVRGEYVYVSNRGDDSISCLHWDQSGMELCSVTPCSGCWPRDFEIIENTIFCTNEKGDTVIVLSVDGTKIKDTGERITMKAPICVTVN